MAIFTLCNVGRLGKPVCDECEEIVYARNQYWEISCVCERRICPPVRGKMQERVRLCFFFY